jgi:hypothetical protein
VVAYVGSAVIVLVVPDGVVAAAVLFLALAGIELAGFLYARRLDRVIERESRRRADTEAQLLLFPDESMLQRIDPAQREAFLRSPQGACSSTPRPRA